VLCGLDDFSREAVVSIEVCAAPGIRHYLLRPYARQSNGKVERFFRTIGDECLHVRPLFTFAGGLRSARLIPGPL